MFAKICNILKKIHRLILKILKNLKTVLLEYEFYFLCQEHGFKILNILIFVVY